MMKVLHYLSKKSQFLFTWNYLATDHGKGVADGLCGETKSNVHHKVLSKTKTAIVQNASDIA